MHKKGVKNAQEGSEEWNGKNWKERTKRWRQKKKRRKNNYWVIRTKKKRKKHQEGNRGKRSIGRNEKEKV
jgi:hypothetical protein